MNNREKSMPSYHDVIIIVNGKEYRITDNYAYQLICTKAGGWNLWWIWNKEERLIGSEYNNDEFIIKVNDTIVCKATSELDE